MLIHCLTCNFKESASSEQIDTFHAALAALPHAIDVNIRTRHGRDLGDRPTNADYAVVSEFDSIEDFYTYLEHPAHQAISLDHLASWSSVQFLVDD